LEQKRFAEIYKRHADTVYRVCMLYFRGSVQDAEDALQTTFLKLLGGNTAFTSVQHERAWLIVTASNVCRDTLRTAWKKRVSFDSAAIEKQVAPDQTDDTLLSLYALPEKYKAMIYLHYYEGFTCEEIGRYLNCSAATVSRHLKKARGMLKTMMLGEAM